MKKYLILFLLLVSCGKTVKQKPDIDTAGWLTGGKIPEIPESERQFKIDLLRIDRDYYFQCDNIAFTTASNLIAMGNLKGGLHWQKEMLKYQRLHKRVVDSMRMYFHPMVDTTK